MSLLEGARCPHCGVLYALTGRVHYCRKDPRVTKPLPVTKPKGGRPLVGTAALSAAERMRRLRERKNASS